MEIEIATLRILATSHPRLLLWTVRVAEKLAASVTAAGCTAYEGFLSKCVLALRVQFPRLPRLYTRRQRQPQRTDTFAKTGATSQASPQHVALNVLLLCSFDFNFHRG